MEAPAGGNQDRGPALLAIFWTECAIALIVVALRTVSRVSYNKLGSDDYAMIITLILFICLTSFVTYYVGIGGCRHLFYLTPSQRLQALKYNWATQPWGIFGFATGKISVSLLIYRLIGPGQRWIRFVLWFIILSVLTINLLGCVFTFVQCNPPSALWDTSLVTEGKAVCWKSNVQSDYAMFLSCWNVCIDIILAVLPVVLFWSLKLHFMKKVSLCVLLGLGLIAAACGIVKIFFLAGLNARSDLTWETYNLFAWSGSELFVIIVCGSAPPIKPLYDRVTGHKKSQNTGYIPHVNSFEDETSLVLTSRSSQYPRGITNQKQSAKGVVDDIHVPIFQP